MKNEKRASFHSRLRDILLSPGVDLAAFLLAAILLLFAGIQGARAALTYFSETYAGRVQMYDIGVTLMENGNDVSYRNYNSKADGTWDEATGKLLVHMLDKKDQDGNVIKDKKGNTVTEPLKIGRSYPEALSIRNSGNINHYARVSIYKYWIDANEKKRTDLSPELIDLHLVNVGGNGSPWILDQDAATEERTVLYYGSLLKVGQTSPAFTDTITIDGMTAKKVTQKITESDGGKTITTTYDYDGVSFQVEAVVDAVQEHNAQDAVLSAWGRDVTISNHTLTLR